ncbi:STAS domain-containing protein [Mycolicibacterium aichiense]|uniref:Sulfate transporter n=1 Tax=Mycolicibacterium aichiense TaxID=1799 RepID=A0AAD1MDP2_9MYCO|nr:STAS domain-containing protein [Mycolicibacterium aichiense]MCV7018737.1 STAS domain-containing protein [Mycolicibacterium aichiense]BBX10787.1 sulfate transporter [Mycolicibacterium aichiense]STZ25556.1 anti-sigma-factor antagonist [Mycolicibacterium aichiense]
MTSATTTAATSAVTRLGRDRTDRGVFRSRELSATTLLIAAVGEIDASNAGDMLGYVEDNVSGYQQLVIDLSKLDFFATDGFSALHTLTVRCSRRGIDWVLVPGPAVARVLRVCDPEGLVTTAGNIVSAVAALARGPHTHLQLAPLAK